MNTLKTTAANTSGIQVTHVVLTKEHFDRAVKQNWNTKTCLMAQCAKDYDLISRNGEIKMVGGCGEYVAPFGPNTAAWKLMTIFDRSFKHVGDEIKPELLTLRESLPITLGELPVHKA